MSHGPVDVFAARSGKVLLIQVKSGSARVKKEELDLLRSFARAFNAEAQVWSFKKRGVLLKVRVSGRQKKPSADTLPSVEFTPQQAAPVAATVPFENPVNLSPS